MFTLVALTLAGSFALSSADAPKPTPIEQVAAQAEQGDPDAIFKLAVAYQRGRGVKEDDAKAAALYRDAAQRGDARAMANLGVMYSRGDGVAHDDALAIEWYRKAADAGSTKAMVMLGTRLAQGQGVDKSAT